jgi:hypothetical protein
MRTFGPFALRGVQGGVSPPAPTMATRWSRTGVVLPPAPRRLKLVTLIMTFRGFGTAARAARRAIFGPGTLYGHLQHRCVA